MPEEPGSSSASTTASGCTPDGEELRHEPRFLSEFVPLRQLGYGSFGTVEAAECACDGAVYAVKVSSKGIDGEHDRQQRLQEAYALSSCCSPHLIRYHDAWLEADKLYLQTELVRGGSVRLLHPGPWPAPAVWDLLLQVGLGLQALHSADLVHLDIKPDNLFGERRAGPGPATVVIKIGDFGLARPVDAATLREDNFLGLNDDEGDCRYLCPQLLRDATMPCLKAVDVYALGVSACELAGADIPAVRLGDFRAMEHLPRRLVELLRAMCSPLPEHRPSTFSVVDAAARECLPAAAVDGPQLSSARAEVAALQAALRDLCD